MFMTYSLAHLSLGTTPESAVRAAAEAGWGSVGLRICARHPGEPYAGPELLGQPGRLHALRGLAADLGVRLSNVSAYQFYPDVTWEHLAPAIEATHALGMRTLVANGFDPDLSRFVPLFARYCRQAAEAGITVALEFLPYSAVRSLDAALEVVERSGCANAGVLLDALHLDRSGLGPADIARVPPGRIAFAQLCDARRLDGPRSDEQLLQEARTARLPAGEGDLPLFEFLEALPAGTEIEYEVARADLAQASPLAKARAALADAQRFALAHAAHRGAQPSSRP